MHTGSSSTPIGAFAYPGRLSPSERAAALDALAALPERLREAVAALPNGGLDTPYREGGWTARQVVHHLADSHLNAYVRTKLALTEDGPSICPYDQERWAELPDMALPVEPSLALLGGLHARWTALLRSLDNPVGEGNRRSAQQKANDGWGRTYVHPEHGRRFALDEVLAHYAWHGRHHTAHVRLAGGWLPL